MSAKKPNGSWGTDRVQTAASGTGYVAFPAHNCDEVTLFNSSGTAIDLRAAGEAGVGVSVPSGAVVPLKVSANANELQIRRTDVAVTQVYVGITFWKK